MSRFDGQVVIVTGAALGIGLGISRAFHDAGASVVLGDVQEDALERAQATFSDQERLAFVQVDVRDVAAVANLVATAEQGFGPPSVMIANAGIVPGAPRSSIRYGRVGLGCRDRDEPSGRLLVLSGRGSEHGCARDARADRHHVVDC